MSTAPSDTPAATPPPTGPGEGHLRRVLGVPALVLFGLVYIVPLTVFTTYGIVTQTSGGRLSVSYLITLAAMVFTARSYARMAAAYPVAGSTYAYTQRTFGPPIGFLAGWSLLLDYLFLPMLNYLVIGIYLNAAIPAVPAWVFVLITIAIVTVLNIIGIVSVARANILIIVMQAVFIVVFLVLAFVTLSHSGTVDLMAPLQRRRHRARVEPGARGCGDPVPVVPRLRRGVDTVRGGQRTDPQRAARDHDRHDHGRCDLRHPLVSCRSWCSRPIDFADVDSGSLDVMTTAGGQFLSTFFTAAYVAGALGSAITSQASVARILYAMGRDGILSRRVFGHIPPRFTTPTYAILVVSVISLGAIWFHLETLASIVSFGALVAFSAVNLTVIKHYFVDAGRPWRWRLRQQPRASADRLRPDRLAVDKPVRFRAGGRIVLACRRVRVAVVGDARVPTADARAAGGGVSKLLSNACGRRFT